MAIRIPLQKADEQRDFYPASWRSVDSDPLGAVGPGGGASQRSQRVRRQPDCKPRRRAAARSALIALPAALDL